MYLAKLRLAFKNACMWPADDPVSKGGTIEPNQIAFYGTDFEFVGPSAMLVPDKTLMPNDMARPLIRDGKWVPSAVSIPETKWCALVDGQRRSDAAGASTSCFRLLCVTLPAIKYLFLP